MEESSWDGVWKWAADGSGGECRWGDDMERWWVRVEVMEEPERPVRAVEVLALATVGAMAPLIVPAILEAPRGWTWGAVVECGGVLAQVRLRHGINDAPGYSMPAAWRWAERMGAPAAVEMMGRAVRRLPEGARFAHALDAAAAAKAPAEALVRGVEKVLREIRMNEEAEMRWAPVMSPAAGRKGGAA